MTSPILEEGFGFWREEVEAMARPEKDVRYIPIIALVGVYTVGITDSEQLTSFHWRRSVLDSVDAMVALRKSLPRSDADYLDETFEVPISQLEPDETVMGGQLRHAHTSLLNGLPKTITTLPCNEIFLGETLGFAQYDHGVKFYPTLALSDQGTYALQNSYPRTAEFVKVHTQ